MKSDWLECGGCDRRYSLSPRQDALQFPAKRVRYFLDLRSKSSYQTVPKIGQTGASTQAGRDIFILTASDLAAVLNDRAMRCQLLLPLGTSPEFASTVVSSAASVIATIGVDALSNRSVCT